MTAKDEFERSVAECVVHSVNDISLERMRDSPDAALRHVDGFLIGLEITRTVDQAVLDAKTRMKDAIDAIRKELIARNISGRFVVYFEIDEMDSTPQEHKKWRRDLPEHIARLLETHLDTQYLNKELLKCHKITRIAFIERARASETIVQLGWRTSAPLGGTLADICLEKKNRKLLRYRKENGDDFHQYWLAIFGVTAGVIEDGGFTMLLNRNFTTAYDRVFLIFFNPFSPPAQWEAREVTPVRPQ
jgi:hypothetical protein